MPFHVAYRIIAGKGRGVVATKPFARDETIERAPVILLPKSDTDLLEETILSRYYYVWKNEEPGAGQSQSAIVLGLGSLYNHSYTPNAIYIRDYEQNEMQYKALRDIEAGEEITVNYNGDPDGRESVEFSAI